MTFEINKKSKVLLHGILNEQGMYYAEQAIVYGTNIVAGVQPNQGGKEHIGIPVYNSIKEACEKTKIDICVIHSSKSEAVNAMIEAIDAKIKIIVCLVGGIPALDMLKVKERLPKDVVLIGPSSLGIIVPEQCKLGVIPGQIVKKGELGVISRHGSLTFEILNQLKKEDIGLSMCISLGSELIKGMTLQEAFKVLHKNNKTKAILILGNIYGFEEEKLAAFYKKIPLKNRKPVIVYMAGSFYEFMGKTSYKEQLPGEVYLTTEQKKELFHNSGMIVIESPAIVAKTTKKVLNKQIYISSSSSG